MHSELFISTNGIDPAKTGHTPWRGKQANLKNKISLSSIMPSRGRYYSPNGVVLFQDLV